MEGQEINRERKEVTMRPKKRDLHELPYLEMVKSGTNRPQVLIFKAASANLIKLLSDIAMYLGHYHRLHKAASLSHIFKQKNNCTKLLCITSFSFSSYINYIPRLAMLIVFTI